MAISSFFPDWGMYPLFDDFIQSRGISLVFATAARMHTAPASLSYSNGSFHCGGCGLIVYTTVGSEEKQARSLNSIDQTIAIHCRYAHNRGGCQARALSLLRMGGPFVSASVGATMDYRVVDRCGKH